MVLVSVVIPTYNRAYKICEAVYSVLNQTYSNIEVIVVDDCSEDDTDKVILDIRDSRVRYIKLEKNRGACHARNVGISLARGEYIAFQDSDDIWENNKLEIQINEMINNKKMISFCDFDKHELNDKRIVRLPIDVDNGIVDKREVFENSIISTQCIVAHKECFRRTLFDENMPRLQDWDLVISLAKEYEIYHIKRKLVDVYVQEDSLTNSPQKAVMALNMLLKKHEDILVDKRIKRSWYLMMAYFKILCDEEPINELKMSLSIKIDFITLLKYILAKFHLLVWFKRRIY